MTSRVFGGVTPAQLKCDLKSGFLVFLIAMPLCLGIAMASGFPPIAGIVTAAVGGIIVSFLGSAPMTIKGPAAGLIVIAIGAVQELGQGDMYLGYRKALAVGVIAASIQIIFGLLRVASVGIAMSPAVVHGMLASIGLIIISKQIHTVFGVIPHTKGALNLLAEIPNSLLHANPEIFLIGLVSLTILFLAPKIKNPKIKSIPAALLVLAASIPMARLFNLDNQHTYSLFGGLYEVGPSQLLTLPKNILSSLAWPDFSDIFSITSIKFITMFALVGSIESTLSVLAVDSMDPKKRVSDLNKDLFAVGVGNLICSIIGGLPMISEIVRSKANIDAKAQSNFSNFFHGVFLLLFVALLPNLLQMIPLAALAAMLVYTGTKLASVHEFLHMKKLGIDQLFLFCATIITTLATDLLVGVTVGVMLEIFLHVIRGATFKSIFWPQTESKISDQHMVITLHTIAAFSSLITLQKLLKSMPANINKVVIDCSKVLLIDHTFLARIGSLADKFPSASLELVGINHLQSSSSHPFSTRTGRVS